MRAIVSQDVFKHLWLLIFNKENLKDFIAMTSQVILLKRIQIQEIIDISTCVTLKFDRRPCKTIENPFDVL